MTDNILLAVDLSHPEIRDLAIPDAVLIARAKDATLHLLAVVPNFGMAMVSDYFPADFERQALEKPRDELNRLAEERMPDDVRWQAHVGHGDIAGELLRVAAEVQATMIVMASDAVEGVRHFLIGSQAERVVSRSPVSVLVVRRASAEAA